jgi:hypothetical protein
MHRFDIISHSKQSDLIVSRPTHNNRLHFYAPDKEMHPDMFKVELYEILESDDTGVQYGNIANGIRLPGESLPPGAHIIGSFYAAPRHILPFHLKCLVRIRTVDAMKFEWRVDRLSSNETAIWVFADAIHHRLYPFSVVIWPPAFPHYRDILDTIRKNYIIVQHDTLSLPKALLLPFVLDVYQGDRRCDKSQLPNKCRHMTPYPTRIGYIKFLAPKADLDRNRVSQTAVKIKALLRERYIPTIKNYVHDIICHISDNASHSREMEGFVKLYHI